MKRSVAIFLSLLILGGIFLITTWCMAYRLAPQHRRRQTLWWLLGWTVKGLVLPAALWAIMNLGVSFELQAFLPQVQNLQTTGGKWYLPFFRFVGYGLFVISSYWMAVTLGWALLRARVGLDAERRATLKALSWTCLCAALLPAVLIEWFGGWPTLGLAASAALLPLAGLTPIFIQIKQVPPMYARAVARVKFGKYAEAEWEIIRELEKCEDDFTGWLMLAELYANNFNDLSEAEQTILEICDHAKVNPSQLSIALHRLADWQLKLGHDPEAARRALQMVCDRLPGTHLARMALLRLNQLPATAEELREQQTARPIPLPALRDPLDDDQSRPTPDLTPQQAADAANICVGQLTRNPNDVAARERLARLFAECLSQVDRGLEQVNLLLGLPDQPDIKRAEWLALAATWQITYRQDIDTGRKLLERITREFPHTPQAFTARRRLNALDTPEYRG